MKIAEAKRSLRWDIRFRVIVIGRCCRRKKCPIGKKGFLDAIELEEVRKQGVDHRDCAKAFNKGLSEVREFVQEGIP